MILRTIALFLAVTSAPAFADGLGQVTYAGSGCPAGTANAVLDDDGTLELAFDAFDLHKGPGLPPTEARKVCQVSLDLRIPQGVSVAVQEATYKGRAVLAAGDRLTIKTNYYSAGTTYPPLDVSMTGPWNRTFTLRKLIPDDKLVYTPCSTRLMPALALYAQVTGDHPELTDDEPLTVSYKLRVRRCLP